jgi:hypothetical protein
MPTKDLKAFERHFYREVNKGKATALAELDRTCASNIVFHNPSGEDIRGLKDFKQYFSEFYDAFPDGHITVHDLVVEGDKAVTRFTMNGTHKGAYGGIPPTNKKMTLSGVSIDRVAGGKFVECWEWLDTLGMMQQLGVVPTSKAK